MSVCIYIKDFRFCTSMRILRLPPHDERRITQHIFPAGHQTYQKDAFKTLPKYP